MIAYVTGTVLSLEGHGLVINMASGIGFFLAVPFPERYGVGTTVSFYTVLMWNQESGPALYGFSCIAEKQLFNLITSCNGIGPKLALLLLAQATPKALIGAILAQDSSLLSSFKGIGPKKAETIIHHLKNKQDELMKLMPVATNMHETGEEFQGGVMRDVADALIALRYSQSEVSRAMTLLAQEEKLDKASFDSLMRQALAHVSRKR